MEGVVNWLMFLKLSFRILRICTFFFYYSRIRLSLFQFLIDSTLSEIDEFFMLCPCTRNFSTKQKEIRKKKLEMQKWSVKTKISGKNDLNKMCF